jgi:TM2 domain-containing membrane protein YozV
MCGVLAILLGGLGIHKFILGNTGAGIIMILITVLTCGSVGPIIGLIEGIIYLTKSDEEFIKIYQVEKKAWF